MSDGLSDLERAVVEAAVKAQEAGDELAHLERSSKAGWTAKDFARARKVNLSLREKNEAAFYALNDAISALRAARAAQGRAE